MRSVQRYLIKARCKAKPLSIDLNDQAELTHSRFGFDETLGRVISLNENYTSNEVSLGLYK